MRANKSKSRQATSRRKLIDKLTVEELPASSRRYPWVAFQQDREAGKDILEVRGISKTIDGEKVLDNVSFIVRRGDKIAFISDNELAMTTLFQILMGEIKPDEGSFKWGVTTSQSYFPKDNNEVLRGPHREYARLDRALFADRYAGIHAARLPRPHAVLGRRCV